MSEWDKIAAGSCRYLLYCFAGPNATLAKWFLIDLSKLRKAYATEKYFAGGSFLAFNIHACGGAVVRTGRVEYSAPYVPTYDVWQREALPLIALWETQNRKAVA